MALDDVLDDLESEGYIAQTFIIPACAVNAPHRRDRVWIIAHSDHTRNSASRCGINENGEKDIKERIIKSQSESRRQIENVTNPDLCHARETSDRNRTREEGLTPIQAAGQSGQRETIFNSGCNNLQGNIITNPNDERCQGLTEKKIFRKWRRALQFKGTLETWRKGWDISSPRLCGVDDGIPNRAHRLKALGNAVVPQIPEIIGRAIMEIENEHEKQT